MFQLYFITGGGGTGSIYLNSVYREDVYSPTTNHIRDTNITSGCFLVKNDNSGYRQCLSVWSMNGGTSRFSSQESSANMYASIIFNLAAMSYTYGSSNTVQPAAIQTLIIIKA